MLQSIARARNIIIDPEREWAAVAGERDDWQRILVRYFAPLALIGPLAYASSILIGAEGALHSFGDTGSALRFAVAAACGGALATIVGAAVTAFVVYLIAPLYRGQRNYKDAFRLVVYAGTPVWIAGIVLVAPLQRFPLLVVIILVALIHSLYLFYVGLPHLAKVPRRDAAECAAIVAAASVALSTVVAYGASAAGLFPQM